MNTGSLLLSSITFIGFGAVFFWVGLSLDCSRSMHFAVTENVADCNGEERQLL